MGNYINIHTRLTAELTELKTKFDALTSFLSNETFETLEDLDKRLLKRQSKVMSGYIKVLERRTRRMGIKAKAESKLEKREARAIRKLEREAKKAEREAKKAAKLTAQ